MRRLRFELLTRKHRRFFVVSFGGRKVKPAVGLIVAGLFLLGEFFRFVGCGEGYLLGIAAPQPNQDQHTKHKQQKNCDENNGRQSHNLHSGRFAPESHLSRQSDSHHGTPATAKKC